MRGLPVIQVSQPCLEEIAEELAGVRTFKVSSLLHMNGLKEYLQNHPLYAALTTAIPTLALSQNHAQETASTIIQSLALQTGGGWQAFYQKVQLASSPSEIQNVLEEIQEGLAHRLEEQSRGPAKEAQQIKDATEKNVTRHPRYYALSEGKIDALIESRLEEPLPYKFQTPTTKKGFEEALSFMAITLAELLKSEGRTFFIGDRVRIAGWEVTGKVRDYARVNKKGDMAYVVQTMRGLSAFKAQDLELVQQGKIREALTEFGSTDKAALGLIEWARKATQPAVAQAVITNAEKDINQVYQAFAAKYFLDAGQRTLLREGRFTEVAAAIIDRTKAKVFTDLVDLHVQRDLIKSLQRWGVLGKERHGQCPVKRKRLEEILRAKHAHEHREALQTLTRAGVKPKVFESGSYTYLPHPKGKVRGRILDPYAIGEQYLEDLLQTVPEFATNPRQKDLIHLATRVIQAKKLPEKKDVMGALSKPNKVFFNALTAPFDHEEENIPRGAPSRQFNVFDSGSTREALQQGLPFPIPEDRKLKGGELLYLAYRDVLVSELLSILEAAGKTHRNLFEDFRTVWQRFNPREYDLPHVIFEVPITLRERYHFAPTRDPHVLNAAAEAAGSCHGGHMDLIRKYVSDPGTVNLIVYEGKKPKGYVRLFLMARQGKEHETVLALDNLEIGWKGFKESNDTVRAMGLAVTQLGLDANVKYILGNDARVKFGIRQAFGNRYMKAELQKIGREDIYGYGFGNGGLWKGEASMLMLNWRVR